MPPQFKRELEFERPILENSARYDVPAWVVRATIGKESSFDPRAYRAEPQIQDASRGLMQVLLSTARGLGFLGDPGNDDSRTGGLYSPEVSIHLGTKLLGQLRQRYPAEPWDRIYGAYNAGSIRSGPGGHLVNEAHVQGWRRLADYFAPGWRAIPVPLHPPGWRRAIPVPLHQEPRDQPGPDSGSDSPPLLSSFSISGTSGGADALEYRVLDLGEISSPAALQLALELSSEGWQICTALTIGKARSVLVLERIKPGARG